MTPDRSHRTAVVAIPPEAVWEPIQAIRRRHDRHAARWMPHVTLLYPFWPEERLAEAVAALAPALAAMPAFDAELATLRWFEHRDQHFTLWLAPEPEAAWKAVHAALLAAAPDCDATARFAHGFTPHLSVGQVVGAARRDALFAEIAAGWAPLRFPLVEVALLRRDPDGPFTVAARLRLAPGA